MKPRAGIQTLRVTLSTLWLSTGLAFAQTPPRESFTNSFRVAGLIPGGEAGIELKGTNAVPRLTAAVLRDLPNGYPLLAGDELRTPRPSRTLLKQSRAILNLEAESVLRVVGANDLPELYLASGRLWFESRGMQHTLTLRTPRGVAHFTGTKFHLEVEGGEAGAARLLLLDGEAELKGSAGSTNLRSGEAGEWPAEGLPRKVQLRARNQVIRWVLYYPGVLDWKELAWPGATPPVEVRPSVAAYQTGNLLEALEKYPRGRTPASAPERIFRAATLLAVGAVDEAAALLKEGEGTEDLPAYRAAEAGGGTARLASALRVLMNTVQDLPCDRREPVTASGWLAESYYQQAKTGAWKATEPWEQEVYRQVAGRDNIHRALIAAKRATRRSPEFGFAVVRVAELEFSRGLTRAARALLNEALERLSPQNAQAWALHGFMAAAAGRRAEAQADFEHVVALDPGLANGWLGGGLVAIGAGHVESGLDALETAAVQEPDNAGVRAYLGKAYDAAGDAKRALDELALARELDPNDPTSWLYSALVKQQANRINEAIADLERSVALNDNRAVFRSQLLLDQDRAVRSANLTSLYRDAGLTDVSVREAGRAVVDDYGNASAHLFLANSYDAWRDPRQITLRYETPWLNEWLLAQLLAPVGAGSLSRTVSQQEYSRLFEGNDLGVFTQTQYTSNGDWVEAASQYGTVGRTAYAVDAFYQSLNGERPNNDLESLTLWATLKQQITPQDSLLFQAGYYDAEAGDMRQLYDPGDAIKTVWVEEEQKPTLLLGYHRVWNPEHQTLGLVGWVNGSLETTAGQDPNLLQGLLYRDADGQPLSEFPALTFERSLDYDSDQGLFTAELQHVWQTTRWTTIVGGRYQQEQFDTTSRITEPSGIPFWPPVVFQDTLADQNVESTFERFSAYGYEYWEAVPHWFTLVGGVVYDSVHFPVNHRSPPISAEEDTEDQVSPKVGFILTPLPRTTLRASYTRSLGGVSYDQSYRLEPTQVAGIVQSYRSLIPESVFGSFAVPQLESAGVLLEHRLPTRTYLAVGADWLGSDATQVMGAFESRFGQPLAPVEVASEFEYEERGLSASAQQLIGDCVSLGVRYRLSETQALQRSGIPELLSSDLEATLHTLDGFALVNLPQGFFAEFTVLWRQQANAGYNPDLPGDNVTQFNLFAGYRFARRRCEIRLGVLNLTDEGYHLNPLSFYLELPRERMLYASLKLDF